MSVPLHTLWFLMSVPQAEEFHEKAHGLLDWLAGVERELRFKGAIPDEESLIVQQIEDHKVNKTCP